MPKEKNIILPLKEINPPSRNQYLLYLIGFVALILNKIRRSIKEYSTPRPFSMKNNIEENVNYTLRVTEQWHEVAHMYAQEESPFLDKSILEIGPGPDLGTGIILLALGAKSYHAIDMFPLALHTPTTFYDKLFKAISSYPMAERAKDIFTIFQGSRRSNNFGYHIVKFPSLGEVSNKKFDIIISQAVLEHVSDPETTIFSLIKISKKGGLFINEVDLATHTRKIREIDPLSILRYDEKIYQKLAFPGTPNRWRASDYFNLSNKAGLKDVKIIPTWRCSNEYLRTVSPHLALPFREKHEDDLAILSCYWLARFP